MDFIHPYTLVICGPTGSGKTQWVKRLVQSQKLKTYWYYSEWQPAYEGMSNVEFIEGLPGDPPLGPALVVIDDQMAQIDRNVTSLFTRGSHHRSLSVILILQNFFSKGPETRTITLNSHYIVLLKNPRDKTIVTSIARQLYPRDVTYMQESYEDATSEPYGYLLADMKQDTPEDLRLKTNVFLERGPYVVVYKRRLQGHRASR